MKHGTFQLRLRSLTNSNLTKTHILIMGVSGCGKSTIGSALAEKLGLPFLEADGFHPATNVEKMRAGIPLDDGDRLPWLVSLNYALKNHENGAVLACSALKNSYRDILSAGLAGSFHIVLLNGTHECILERLQARKGHFMPVNLLKSQFDILETPADGLLVSIEKPIADIIKSIEGSIKTKFR